MGAAYGLPGAIIAGCAAGKIGGGSCSEGALNAVGTYAVYSAVGYIARSSAAASTRSGFNEAAAPSSPSGDAILNVVNQRDEAITVKVGELTVNVGSKQIAGPYALNAGSTALGITTVSGDQFGANVFRVVQNFRYDIFVSGTDYVSQVFSSAMMGFASSQGLHFNGSENFYVQQVNIRPVPVDMSIGGMKVFSGNCGISAGCAK